MANLLGGIIVGVGLISLIVGGLSVVNTMAMSVNERTREIGIKRAIGGSRRRIVGELVAEAGLIGFIGGLIGVGLGALAVYLGNLAGEDSGTVLFTLTAGTVLASIVFATVLGMAAGIDPRRSRGAARSRPRPSIRIGASDMALLEARNLRKTYRLGKTAGVAGPARSGRHDRGRRDGRDHGPVGVRQERPSCTSSACSTSPTSTALRGPAS